MKDIRFVRDELQLVKTNNFTTRSIREQIENYTITKRSDLKLDTKIENSSIPMFCESFFLYVFTFEQVPSEQEFMEFYMKKNKHIYTPENTDGINGRLLRSYPSLIRDLHFYHLAKESGLFEQVYYSYVDDIGGIDVTVVVKGQEYGISLFVESPRSLQYKERKYKRHDYSGIKEIPLPLQKTCFTQVGGIRLYNHYYFNTIMKEIERFEQSTVKK